MQTMMWGGSDEPCALCQVASLGAINLKNNKAVCKDICDMLSEAPFGIKPDRTYVEFRDVPRENMVSPVLTALPAGCYSEACVRSVITAVSTRVYDACFAGRGTIRRLSLVNLLNVTPADG
jgi:hypothetical protein